MVTLSWCVDTSKLRTQNFIVSSSFIVIYISYILFTCVGKSSTDVGRVDSRQ